MSIKLLHASLRSSPLLKGASIGFNCPTSNVRTFKPYRKRKNEDRIVSVWTNVRQFIHIEEPEVVQCLIQQLKQDLIRNPNTKHVLEVYPGKALLTKALLEETDLGVIALTDKKSSLTKLKVMHLNQFVLEGQT
jgi:hypothetical protein